MRQVPHGRQHQNQIFVVLRRIAAAHPARLDMAGRQQVHEYRCGGRVGSEKRGKIVKAQGLSDNGKHKLAWAVAINRT